MFNTFKMLFVAVVLYVVWAAPGSAFQLFGSNDSLSGSPPRTSLQSPVDGGAQSTADQPLALGEGNEVDALENERMNIWIPGLGVVGKMPKLDFGLEMLYGAQNGANDVLDSARELEEFDSDFAIKGTIKRKF